MVQNYCETNMFLIYIIHGYYRTCWKRNKRLKWYSIIFGDSIKACWNSATSPGSSRAPLPSTNAPSNTFGVAFGATFGITRRDRSSFSATRQVHWKSESVNCQSCSRLRSACTIRWETHKTVQTNIYRRRWRTHDGEVVFYEPLCSCTVMWRVPRCGILCRTGEKM